MKIIESQIIVQDIEQLMFGINESNLPKIVKMIDKNMVVVDVINKRTGNLIIDNIKLEDLIDNIFYLNCYEYTICYEGLCFLKFWLIFLGIVLFDFEIFNICNLLNTFVTFLISMICCWFYYRKYGKNIFIINYKI